MNSDFSAMCGQNWTASSFVLGRILIEIMKSDRRSAKAVNVPVEMVKPWQRGMDLPYVIPFGANGTLAIALRAEWLKSDRAGNPLLLPPAVRAMDQLHAVFSRQSEMTPGFIVSLREAMGLTQEQFAGKVSVSKMTVSRW